jgi:hypothetical protein
MGGDAAHRRLAEPIDAARTVRLSTLDSSMTCKSRRFEEVSNTMFRLGICLLF